MATRWAICGTGKISSDFCTSLKYLPESEHQIVAVPASSKAKASEFASRFGIPESFGSYDELCNLDNVDVIYVGVFHPLHVNTCLTYINAGKNVLCEKPMALTLDGCKKVLTAAKEKGVLFVEATWSRWFPVYDVIREQVASGALGDIKMVESHFCIKIDNAPRVMQMELGGGALMDIGLYAVQAANLIFKGKPEDIVAKAFVGETGADLTGVITLQYSGGRFASLTYSAQTQGGANSMIIRGTKGNIQIPDHMWSPTKMVMPNGELKEFPFPDIKGSDKYNFANSHGLMYEAKGIRECLLKGLKESPKMPHEDSETIMAILQDCYTQFGLKYQFP